MKTRVFEAASLFCTDRKKFENKYANNPIVGELMHEIFMESESRPELCERIPILLLGHIPSEHKRGYDGVTQAGRPVEVKVRSVISNNGRFPRSETSFTINDVSENIIERYKKDNPLMLFPYFFDGHLAAIFSVDYSVIHHKYLECVQKKKTGRCSFKLSAISWLEHSQLEFAHSDLDIVYNLPRILVERIRYLLVSSDPKMQEKFFQYFKKLRGF